MLRDVLCKGDSKQVVQRARASTGRKISTSFRQETDVWGLNWRKWQQGQEKKGKSEIRQKVELLGPGDQLD